MSVLLGGFDSGASTLMFEKDISNLAKPSIKGRGFVGSGTEIIETQTYYTVPENDWVFDEDQLLTYNNPVFVEQCRRRNKDFDALNTGWVKQCPLDELDKDSANSENDLEDLDIDLDDDDDDDNGVPVFKFGGNKVKTFQSKTEEKIKDNPKDVIQESIEEDKPKILSKPSNRDHVNAALNEISGDKPKVKLNIDKTVVENTTKPSNKKTIKLNIKPKQ